MSDGSHEARSDELFCEAIRVTVPAQDCFAALFLEMTKNADNRGPIAL
jgi:hypothetical protein